MKLPHPIPYQGSKRKLAPAILRHFPSDATRLIEPFAGAAAVSMAAAHRRIVKRIILNDINAPLISLWREIIEEPESVAGRYRRLWEFQLGRERTYYDWVRERFNKTQRPEYLLYLLARCVKASVRYNAQGEFNQSPDNRRRGMNPATMRHHILCASKLLRGITEITALDYRQALQTAGVRDIVYMDPPYQGVSENHDLRYIGGLDFDVFVSTLEGLNSKRISYILSYDGKAGEKAYGKPLPNRLGLLRIEIDAGRSSQATLLGRAVNTYESIYLSPALLQRIPPVVEKQVACS